MTKFGVFEKFMIKMGNIVNHRHLCLYILLFSISVLSFSQVAPQCGNKFYTRNSTGNILAFQNVYPATSPTPTGVYASNLIGVGPAFSFTAPNPTFWNIAAGQPYYYTGTTWSLAPHSFTNNGTYKLAGSSSYLYALWWGNRIVRYNGASNAVVIATLGTIYHNIAADDQDRIYLMYNTSPQMMTVFDPAVNPICSYTLNGLPANNYYGFAINGNTVCVGDASSYYVGYISGSVINFSSTTGPGYYDSYATCPRVTTFSSSISATPGPSLSCQQVNTLVISSPYNASANFQWTGPGLISALNSSVVNVNLPGVYNCTILTTDCPPMKSVSSYTVINAGGFFNAVTSSSGSLTCTSPTTQLFASPSSSAHTYSWSGPGIVSAPNAATINVNAAGAYSVVVTNTVTGCISTAAFGLNSGIAPLNLSTNPGDLNLCAPASPQTFTASGASSFTWSPSASISSTLGAVVTITPNGNATYSISGTLGVCSGNTVLNIFVTPSATLATNISNTTICAGNTVNLNVSGAYAYTWSPGNNNGSSLSVSPGSTLIYTVTGNYGGCLSTAEVTVFVNANPIIGVSGTYSYMCQGMSNTLSASGAQTYTWYPGAVVSNSIVPNPPPSVIIYTVQGTNAQGCTGSGNYSLYVSNVPPLVITPTNPAVCPSQTILLMGQWGFNTYNWSGPNIIWINTYSAIATPSVSSVYTLQAISTSPACNRTATVNVAVYSAPTVSIAASSNSVCAGIPVVLSPSGAITYSLGFPALQTGLQFTVSPSTNATYTVYGTNTTNCVGSNTVQIAVTPTPNIFSNASPSQLCPGGTATLVATGATNYTWNPGAITGSIIQVSPQTTTVYSITGSIGQCFGANSLTLLAVPNPTINITASSYSICSTNQVGLFAQGASSYTWQPGNIAGYSVSVFPTTSTQYTLYASSQYNCRDTAFVNIHVDPTPTINIISQPIVFCSGAGGGTLTASGASNFTWQPGNFYGQNYSINPSANTVYTITGLTGPCSSSVTQTINITPNPTLTVNSSPTIVCPGGPSNLSVSGASTYTWIGSGQTLTTIVVNPISTTNYTVQGTSLGCTSSTMMQVSVYVNSIQVTTTASLICSGESSTITASGAVSYTWSTMEIGAQIVVAPLANTIYVLNSTYGLGCSHQSSISIEVSECLGLGANSLEEKKPHIYPNPNTGEFVLDSKEGELKLFLYDGLGQLVREEEIKRPLQIINISELANGVYFLRVFNDKGGLDVFRIVKE